MDTEDKSSGSRHEHSAAGKFRRYVVAPASILSTVLYVFFFVGEVREKFHHAEESHETGPKPSLLEAMRASVDHQLQQIRSVDAKSLGSSFGNDLDTHDCNWRFHCTVRAVNFFSLVGSSGSSEQLQANRTSLLSQQNATPRTSIFTPSAPTIHSLAQPSHQSVDLSHSFDEANANAGLTASPNRAPIHPLSQKEIDDLFNKMHKASVPDQPQQESAQPLHVEKDQPLAQLQNNSTAAAPANAPSSEPQIKNEALSRAVERMQAAYTSEGPPKAVIRFGPIPVPTFHTLFGTPHALGLAAGKISSSGPWAVTLFFLCTCCYLGIVIGIGSEDRGSALIAYIMVMASPVVVPFMVLFVQWVAGGLFHGVSWVFGELVLLAAYAGGLSLIVALPHIFKAPREVVEAAEVIRNV
jgi:hypothetical protein